MLQRQIEQGIYRVHQKLPSERALCRHYNLSRMTVRRALQSLISEGLAYTQAGKGTFVGKKTDALSHNSFGSDLDNSKFGSPEKIPQYYQPKLIDQLVSFNSAGIEKVISKALTEYSAEDIALKLFSKVITQLEVEWQQGRVSLQAHNYAITTLHAYLVSMFKTAGNSGDEIQDKILLACAPDDHHEIGLLALALGLKQRGYQVIYLGSNIAVSDLHTVVEAAHPTAICFSASTQASGETLAHLPPPCLDSLQLRIPVKRTENPFRPLFVFGGTAFNKNPSLIQQVPGIYLGDTIEVALERFSQILLD